MWFFVFTDTMDQAFGKVASRLLRPANNDPNPCFTDTEWNGFYEACAWQRKYAKAVDRHLYTIIIKSIVRGTEAGETLIRDIMAATDNLSSTPESNATPPCHPADPPPLLHAFLASAFAPMARRPRLRVFSVHAAASGATGMPILALRHWKPWLPSMRDMWPPLTQLQPGALWHSSSTLYAALQPPAPHQSQQYVGVPQFWPCS